MSNLEDYLKEMEKDVIFDDFTIKETQMKLPAIKHKWVGRLIRHKQTTHSLQSRYDKLKKTLIDEARKNSSYNMTIPALEKVVVKHEKLIQIQDEIDNNNLLIEFLEKAERLFNSMSFDIKNLIEIMKMETL